MSIMHIIAAAILGFLFFIITERVSIIKRFKDNFEKLLQKKAGFIAARPFVISAAAVILNQDGYIAVNSAAIQAYDSVAPPCAPPADTAQNPAKPDLSNYDYLQDLIITAFIPFYQDINNDKTELILSDHYVIEYISNKVAEAILFYSYQNLDFIALEKKIYLEIARKLSTIYATAEKYQYDADAIIASNCKPLLKKAILAYISYYSICVQSLDTPVSAGNDGDKEQTLYDYISDDDDARLSAGLDDDEFDDNIDGDGAETALPLNYDETPAPRNIMQKAHRQPRQTAQQQDAQQLGLFAEVQNA